MNGVPDPECAIVNVCCYGKGQSIIIDKIGKNLQLVKSKDKIAGKEKDSKKLVNNLSKTAEIKIRGLLRVQQPKPLGRLGQIQEAQVRKT